MHHEEIKKTVLAALKEDIGAGDITTTLVVGSSHKSKGVILTREDVVLCGMAFAHEVFSLLDPKMEFMAHFKDGDKVKKGASLITLNGKTRAILTGERVALNFLSYLSAIATRTHFFTEAVKPYPVKILDTRKTTPCARPIERYAVRCGGGVNHRFNLHDMVLLKDNHRVISREKEKLSETVRRLHIKTHKKIEIEVDHLWELEEVLKAHPEMVLLDNMTPLELKKAVVMTRKCCPNKPPLLEASGGITLENVKKIAATGVDRISVGSLTHSRKAIDMTLELMG
ncbi:MAG: carboxylating nicotinate-nucleotide diphosphorylase [Candidatus Omnitrophica bacterium]|nr:carboxylating nicotinate-nucleotide diphosphorylase [Candidatus Omnitrophota bacterium]